MKARRQRIASITLKIANLTEKCIKLKNRISKLQQTLKTLRKESEAERDALILADAKNRLQSDPEEFKMFRTRLNRQPLTDEQRALFDSDPKDAGDAERDAPDSATSAATDTPRSTANSVDGAPAGTPDAGAAAAATPDSTEHAAPDESRSRANHLDGDAAPTKQRSTQAAAPSQPASDGQDPSATPKQIDFVEALIAKRPEEARNIGIDAASLATLSRKKASWVIKTLKG